MSRGRGSGARLSRTRLARPGLSSTSTSALPPAPVTAARSTARSAPCRTSGASVATRWLPSVARYPTASTRLVFPSPFGPLKMLTPAPSSRLSSA